MSTEVVRSEEIANGEGVAAGDAIRVLTLL